jgi:ABC-type phosphate transport system substrate-binding protein
VLAFRVGTDAVAVVICAENDLLTELTLEQLGQIYSGAVTTWSEVDTSYPATTSSWHTTSSVSPTAR